MHSCPGRGAARQPHTADSGSTCSRWVPVLHRIVEPMLGPRAGSRMNDKVWSTEQ
jgi:hypothetical protein